MMRQEAHVCEKLAAGKPSVSGKVSAVIQSARVSLLEGFFYTTDNKPSSISLIRTQCFLFFRYIPDHIIA